jgi:hypothetical protein
MTEKNDFFVQVTLTPEQARLTVDALDLFSRIHLGQFSTILEQFIGVQRSDGLDEAILAVRQACLPELSPTLNHSYGISSGEVSERGKLSWDILQVIRHCESHARNPKGGYTVNFNKPMFYSDSEPRPTAKAVSILDRLSEI